MEPTRNIADIKQTNFVKMALNVDCSPDHEMHTNRECLRNSYKECG